MKKAFTLQELLFAMAIIGIITLVTLPNLSNYIFSRANITSLQSAYNSIDVMLKKVMQDQRKSDLNYTTIGYYYNSANNNRMLENIKIASDKYFKVLKSCEFTLGDCFASEYHNVNGDSVVLPEDGLAYCFLLSTGAAMCISPTEQIDPFLTLVIDVNGKHSPNIAGRDLFTVFVYSDGEIGDRDANHASACTSNTSGLGCFTRLIDNEWVMDY